MATARIFSGLVNFQLYYSQNQWLKKSRLSTGLNATVINIHLNKVQYVTLTQYAFKNVTIQALLPIIACQTFANQFCVFVETAQQKAGSGSCCFLCICFCDVTFIHINPLSLRKFYHLQVLKHGCQIDRSVHLYHCICMLCRFFPIKTCHHLDYTHTHNFMRRKASLFDMQHTNVMLHECTKAKTAEFVPKTTKRFF